MVDDSWSLRSIEEPKGSLFKARSRAVRRRRVVEAGGACCAGLLKPRDSSPEWQVKPAIPSIDARACKERESLEKREDQSVVWMGRDVGERECS